MRGDEFVGRVTYVVETCYHCELPFAMTEDFKEERMKDKKTFYCPAGHRQVYVGLSAAQKLKNANSEAERLREQRDAERRSRAALKGQITKLRKRLEPPEEAEESDG